MEQYNERLTKIEWRVDGHENEISILKQTSTDLKTTLEIITMTLKQIKWIAVGAGAVVFADQLGIMGALKLAAL